MCVSSIELIVELVCLCRFIELWIIAATPPACDALE